MQARLRHHIAQSKRKNIGKSQQLRFSRIVKNPLLLIKFLRGILCTEFSQIVYGRDCGMNILMWERVSY